MLGMPDLSVPQLVACIVRTAANKANAITLWLNSSIERWVFYFTANATLLFDLQSVRM